MRNDQAAQTAWRIRSLDEAQIGVPRADLIQNMVAVGRGEHDLDRSLATTPGGSLQRHEPARQELLGDGQAGAHPLSGHRAGGRQLRTARCSTGPRSPSTPACLPPGSRSPSAPRTAVSAADSSCRRRHPPRRRLPSDRCEREGAQDMAVIIGSASAARLAAEGAICFNTGTSTATCDGFPSAGRPEPTRLILVHGSSDTAVRVVAGELEPGHGRMAGHRRRARLRTELAGTARVPGGWPRPRPSRRDLRRTVRHRPARGR